MRVCLCSQLSGDVLQRMRESGPSSSSSSPGAESAKPAPGTLLLLLSSAALGYTSQSHLCVMLIFQGRPDLLQRHRRSSEDGQCVTYLSVFLKTVSDIITIATLLKISKLFGNTIFFFRFSIVFF